MKKNTLLFISCLLMLAMVSTSCDFKKSTPNISDGTAVIVSDSLRIVISPEAMDSMLFIPNEGQPLCMDMADCEPLSEYLKEAVYDTILNKSGIMMKMQAPDYTVIFYHKNKTTDESDWLMIWKENGRTKFANEWYNLAESNRNSIYDLLDRYNNPVK